MLWAQPTAGFTSQFVTNEVAQELVSPEWSSRLPTCAVGGQWVQGQSGGLSTAAHGEQWQSDINHIWAGAREGGGKGLSHFGFGLRRPLFHRY